MTDQLPDTLTITGLGKRLDGEYHFDVGEMLGIGGPAGLTGNEAHTIKQVSGVRAGELEENLIAGDWDTLLALAIVVMARNGKQVGIDQLRGLPLSAVEFDFQPRQVAAEEDDADDPPAVADVPPSANGGSSGSETSAPLVSVPPRTGPPGSERFATYDQVTSAS